MSTQHPTTAPPMTSPLDQRIDELARDATWRADLTGLALPAAMAEYLDFDSPTAACGLQALVAGHIEARLEPSGLLNATYGRDGHPLPAVDYDD